MAVLTIKATRQPGRYIVDVQGPGPGQVGASWTARTTNVGKVKVNYGVYSIEEDLAGVSVGWVRNRYKHAWNIRAGAVGQVNWVGVADTSILQAGDVLSFVFPPLMAVLEVFASRPRNAHAPCAECGHAASWHRLDDATNLSPTDPAARFRCVGYNPEGIGPRVPCDVGCRNFVPGPRVVLR